MKYGDRNLEKKRDRKYKEEHNHMEHGEEIEYIGIQFFFACLAYFLN